ncbi:helix-turn-helix domain-containing protein [Streptomyces griseoviridis]
MKRSPNGSRPGNWRELPPELPPDCARLVTCLRRIKDREGLTLERLAETTAVSRSSWERYLNGRQFPPRHAVEALCQAVPDERDRQRALSQWELADAAWSRRTQGAPSDRPESAQASAPRSDSGSGSDRRPDRPASPGTDRAGRSTSGAGTGVRRRQRQDGLLRGPLLAASAVLDAHPVASAAGVALLCAAMLVPAAVVHASRGAVGPAASAPPPVCLLRSCEGRSPQTTACEDPVTVARHTAADGTRLEIRLSPGCRAAWIRAWPTHTGFGLVISGPDAEPQSAVRTIRSAQPEAVATTMISAGSPGRLRACYRPVADRPARECFGTTP